MYRNQLCLDGEWQLSAIDATKFDETKQPVCFNDLKDEKWLKATVPGNFELDFVRAGLLPDPYFGKNVLLLQETETLHLFYSRIFTAKEIKNAYLKFEGIDTYADVFLNGIKVGSTDNMLIAHEMKAIGLKQGKNELFIHIRPAYTEARKHPLSPNTHALRYNYDSLYVRKPPHAYGWDIMPRILSGGIWRSVFLVYKKDDYIDDVFGYTNSLRENDAELVFFFNVAVSEPNIRQYKIKLCGKNKESSFFAEQTLWHTSGKLLVTLKNAKLWWPKNYGKAELYETQVCLYKNDELVDSYAFSLGVRTIELDRTSLVDVDGTGEFKFVVNGKPIYVMGTNWVPADAFHSRDKERIPQILPMLTDLGCNAVRCWGGNVYEDDVFYDFCDKNGILVWQDFAMACAAYPQEEEFYEIMRKEAKTIVKRLRNHPSLALWSGDNECDYVYVFNKSGQSSQNPNLNKITRKVLAEILQAEDFTRPYLPSSPYVDDTAYAELDFKNVDFNLPPQKYISEDHLWGPRDYFKSEYYKGSSCRFASEMGYHGCNAVRSIKRFISPDKLWPWNDNDEWLTHSVTIEGKGTGDYAYRIALMAEQVKTLFGIQPNDLETFALASQISQAEAMKFFVERFRVEKGKKTGLIWWNLIDGWPQFSDAVVDYYQNKKLAYFYIRRSQAPLCMMFGEPNNEHECTIYAVSEYQEDKTVEYVLQNVTTGKTIKTGSFIAKADCSNKLFTQFVGDTKDFYLLTWRYDDKEGKNHYVANAIGLDFEEYVRCMRICSFEVNSAK